MSYDEQPDGCEGCATLTGALAFSESEVEGLRAKLMDEFNYGALAYDKLLIANKRRVELEAKLAALAKCDAELEVLRKTVKAMDGSLVYIRSAYCDDLETAKEFADKGLAEAAKLRGGKA